MGTWCNAPVGDEGKEVVEACFGFFIGQFSGSPRELKAQPRHEQNMRRLATGPILLEVRRGLTDLSARGRNVCANAVNREAKKLSAVEDDASAVRVEGAPNQI
jgi:hypothetical protein